MIRRKLPGPSSARPRTGGTPGSNFPRPRRLLPACLPRNDEKALSRLCFQAGTRFALTMFGSAPVQDRERRSAEAALVHRFRLPRFPRPLGHTRARSQGQRLSTLTLH